MTEVAGNRRITELDSLRGIAAFVVMLYHYGWRYGEMFPAEPHLAAPIQWGSYGVHLFFAISGFVIYMTLDRTSRPIDFIVARFSRLYPAYWACIALTVVTLAMLPMPILQYGPSTVLANLSMIHVIFGYASVDGVYWTLLIELFFYAAMLCLWRLGLLRRPELMLFGWITLKLVWWAVDALPDIIGAFLILKFIPFFAIGMASYRIWTGARTLLQQLPILLFGLAATWVVQGGEDAVVYAVVAVMLIALALGALKHFSHPVLLWLGAISYPLYLLHQNIGYALITYSQREGVPVMVAPLIAIMASLGLAYLVHKLVEQPSLNIIRSWWKSVKTRKLVASTV